MNTPRAQPNWEFRFMATCGGTLGGGLLCQHLLAQPFAADLLYLLCYLSGGYYGLRQSLRSLRQGKVDVDLLMILAALGAAYVGAPFEGGMLLFLFSLSNVLQNHALDRSRHAIKALMQLRPTEVLCQTESGFEPRPVESVTPGTLARLGPGDRIALDGIASEGRGSVDESSLTGESLPVEKAPGSPLFAGTLNLDGSLLYRVTKSSSESTLARIIAMVEHAQARKAKTERYLEKAERYYAAGVILLTLGLIALPPLLAAADFSASFYRAMTVMVVASPCALIISTPAAFLAAIAGAARRGILFKGGVHLERLASVDTVAFDKTGTLTTGRPQLRTALAFPTDSAAASDRERRRLELVQIAASLESRSEHPIAQAIGNAAKEARLPELPVTDFRALPGKGASATVAQIPCLIGSPSLIAQRHGTLEESESTHVEAALARGETALLLAQTDTNGAVKKVLGLLTISDTLRPEAAPAIAALRRAGVKKIVMLTGDARQVADETARQLGIDHAYSELLPEDKLKLVRSLSKTHKVAMIGDGINDAPALAAAHVGIAMGASGTEVAMETADIVLMSSQLGRLAEALDLARRSRRIVTQNLSFAIAVIVLLVSLALSTGIPLPLGVIGHEGSTVLVCLNGLRLLAKRNPDA